jgi:membrane-bound serine protease (ClpP class)
MNIRTDILSILSDPTTSYVVLLVGVMLLIIELIRPGFVVPGIVGAVSITVALKELLQWSWTAHGTALLVGSVIIALSSIRTSSFVGPAVSAVLYTAGSYLGVSGGDRIHPAAALAGGAIAFSCASLLQIGFRARAAKCHR